MKRKVFVAIPSHSGELTRQTQMTLTLMAMEAAGLGWELIEFVWARDSLVAHARNACVAMFLKSDADVLFMLDDDVACGPGVFARLMSHEVDFACGIYRAKCEPPKYFVRFRPGEELWTNEHTGLLEAQDVPLGFARITRAAVQKMVDANADNWFVIPSENLKCWELFQTEVRDHQFTGEDFFFCRKMREAGIKVWIDPELPLVHVLPSMPGRPGREQDQLFHGHFGDHLRAKMKEAA